MKKSQVKVLATTAEIVPLVKSLRLVADLGLKDAKDLADFLRDSAPRAPVAGIDREVADHVVEFLQNAGLSATVEGSSLTAPMLLRPAANQKYVWHWPARPRPRDTPGATGRTQPESGRPDLRVSCRVRSVAPA